jgi:TRAP-type mannitol/chloroaromatic compound transport system substrate-binding protein
MEETPMKRRQFLKVAGAGVAVSAVATSAVAQQTGKESQESAVAAPAVAQSNPEVRWRLTASWPKSLDTLYGSCETFSRYVAEATDNKFQVQPFAAGEIVPGLQVLDAVQNGTVEACHTATYYFIGKDPTWALFCAVPFSVNTRQQNAWFQDGDGLKLMNEFGKKFNVFSLVSGNTGAQMGGWFRKEIKTVDDLKGLKFRIGGWAGKTLQKLGVVPQQIAGGDIYPALEKGTIDAAEWVGPYDDEKLGFHKVAQYYYYPGWWEGGTANHFMFNLEKWNQLPKSYQAIVTAAAGFVSVEQTARYDARNPAALKRLIAAGTQLRPFSQPIMEACLKASHEVNAETSASNQDYKRVWESIQAFRNDGYAWWQVAEFGYDNFMIRTGVRV